MGVRARVRCTHLGYCGLPLLELLLQAVVQVCLCLQQPLEFRNLPASSECFSKVLQNLLHLQDDGIPRLVFQLL